MKSVVFKINDYDKNKSTKNNTNDNTNNNSNDNTNNNTNDNNNINKETISTKSFSNDNSNKPVKLVENIFYFKK